MKSLIFLPYFGTFPNYFDLYLETVRRNPEFDWLIFTDDQSRRDYPENVRVVYMDYSDMIAKIQSKFDFEINLERKHKLCDFRAAYGDIFQDYLQDYDYWGHCDSDVLWGKFTNFIDFEKLQAYDKIFAFGHLSFYKNNPENNRRYLLPLNGQPRYKEVFSNLLGYAFDEKFDKSINAIFLAHGCALYTESFVADIDPYHTNFRLSVLDMKSKKYFLDSVKDQIFTWENGQVFRYFLKNGELVKQEFLYIHLQKRAMEIDFTRIPTKILINPKDFAALNEPITKKNFGKYVKKYWFNNQFFKIKYRSFKFRLKHKKFF